MSAFLQVAVAASWSWTALYTGGLDEMQRSARRAEIESDLWELRNQHVSKVSHRSIRDSKSSPGCYSAYRPISRGATRPRVSIGLRGIGELESDLCSIDCS